MYKPFAIVLLFLLLRCVGTQARHRWPLQCERNPWGNIFTCSEPPQQLNLETKNYMSPCQRSHSMLPKPKGCRSIECTGSWAIYLEARMLPVEESSQTNCGSCAHFQSLKVEDKDVGLLQPLAIDVEPLCQSCITAWIAWEGLPFHLNHWIN